MVVEYDTAKREKILLERGLDFADADKIFDGLHFTLATIVVIMARTASSPSDSFATAWL